MNWIKRIGALLGRFWTRLFGDSDFILAVENLLGMVALRQQAAMDRWMAGRALSLDGRYQDRLPYLMLLCRRSVSATGEVKTESGGRACTLLHLLDNPGCDITEVSNDTGYSFRMLHPVPCPSLITDHVLDSTRTLFLGLDYVYDGEGWLRLFVDPDDPDSGLGWPTIIADDGNSGIVECYRVFGWARASDAVEDAVAAFESPELVDCAEAAWDVHQNGATVLSAKRLLGAASGSVVCESDCTVSGVWTEEDGRINCVLAGDRLYCSEHEPPASVLAGAVLAAGDTVLGGLECYPRVDYSQGSRVLIYPDADQVPGIHVSTDAGDLYAENSDSMSADVLDGENMLPLRLAGEPCPEYMERCAALRAAGAPDLPVPDKVNPFVFVLDRLRAGCCMLASVPAGSVRKMAAALACIRRSAIANGMLKVYIRAEGEPAVAETLVASATANRAAVAVEATAAVHAAAAKAEVLI